MNIISKFIKIFALVFCATTAVTSFGTEPQKDSQEKEKQEIFVWYEIKKFAAEYWLPITAMVGTWLFKGYFYEPSRNKILGNNIEYKEPLTKEQEQELFEALRLLGKSALIGGACFAAGVYLDKKFVKPRFINLNAVLVQMEKQTKK